MKLIEQWKRELESVVRFTALHRHECPECERIFHSKRFDAEYCSTACRMRAMRRRQSA